MVRFPDNQGPARRATRTFFWCAAAALLLLAQSTSFAEQTAHVLDARVTHSTHLSYLLFLPADYPKNAQARWPLILYLHGGSLRGDDLNSLRTLGLPHKLESEPNFPFVVVSPQCPAGEIWTDANAIEVLLDHVTHDYRVDPTRVYITGHSMGGRGALYFAYRLPGRFAAVVALSPISPITSWAARLADIPLWLIQGSADTAAPLPDTKDLVQAIQGAGGHPRFDVLGGRDHFILDAYDRPDIYEWLLAQRKPAPGGSTP